MSKKQVRAHSWKRAVYRDVEFPSGNVADLRRPDVMAMMAQNGNIPNALYDALFSGNADDVSEIDNPKEYIEGMLAMGQRMALRCFVSPVVVPIGETPDYDNNEIDIEDIHSSDLQFLIQWSFAGGEPAEALKRFLERQQAGLANL